ncbi:MAG: helix-turn-helix domain-containing protein [Inhella sp.]
MSEALALLDAALRGGLITLLALVGWQLQRRLPAGAAARPVLVLFLPGLVVQLIGSTPAFEAQVPRAWQAPWVAVAVGNAVGFWCLVRLLFDDDFRLHARHLLAWAAVAAVGAAYCLLPPHPALTLLLRGAPLLCAAATLWVLGRGWSADLLEARRRLRLGLVSGGVAYTVLGVGLRLGTGGAPGPLALLDLLGLGAVIALGAAALLGPQAPRWQRLFLVEAEPPPAPSAAAEPAPAAPDAELLARLEPWMRERQPYRDEGLSLAGLAAELAVPGYRLRRAINQGLGFRNFNAYVNQWRLDEARAALTDPAQQARSVLDIALAAGFGSIGPFNRAFKAETGLTPTEFRRAQLAES